MSAPTTEHKYRDRGAPVRAGSAAETFSPAELAEAGADVAPLLRIELEAGVAAAACATFDEFVDRLDAALAGAPAAGYMGLKSVLAYRSGLAVEPRSRSGSAPARPAGRWGSRSRSSQKRASSRPAKRSGSRPTCWPAPRAASTFGREIGSS